MTLVAFCLALAGCSRPRRTASPEEHAPPLPDDAFRVQWISVEPVSELVAGARATFAVKLRNRGSATWPDAQAAMPSHPTGMYAVRLAWRCLDPRDGRVIQDRRARSDLPWPVRPGKDVILPIQVDLPAIAGKYEIEFELVQEDVAWFASKGADRLILPIVVAGP